MGDDEKDHRLVRTLSRTLRHYWLWGAVVLVGVTVFAQWPGTYAATSHSLLRGLCAQTPSHTFMLNGELLPFDARMTGIYGGLLMTVVWLAVRGRMFRSGDIPLPVMAFLALLVGVMAVDGFNSLFTDLQLAQVYPPTNIGRLVSGYGAGVALGVVLCWLVAASAWRISRPLPGVSSLRELMIPMAGLAIYGPIVVFGPDWMLLPVTAFLVVAAWLTTTLLMLVIVLLAFRYENQISSFRALHVPVAIAATMGVVAMLLLAGGRFWLERSLGISNAMM